MKLKTLSFFSVFALFAVMYSGCRKDAPAFDLETAGYPDKIGQIMLTNCAISGCHNDASAHAAAGLNLSSWNSMMSGDRNGAVVIPYSHEHSTLFMYCNTFHDLGVMMEPTMPYNDDPLTREEMITLRDWINAGAPSREGKIAFSGNPSRKKYYVTNQACDVVTVFDQETGLPMRYIPVGADFVTEFPHSIRLSPDGQYWYVCFASGRYIEKYRTSDDAFFGRILLGPDASAAYGSWNTMAIAPDGRHAFAIDWNNNGRVVWVDLESMQYNLIYQSSDFRQTHGSCVSPDGNALYVTTTMGNYVYKFDVSDPANPGWEKIIIDGVSTQPTNQVNDENGHEILLSPDGTKYFITCSGTNEVRVLDAVTDQLIGAIPVGVYPQELAFSENTPYAYVTCTEDSATYPGKRGSVYIINWQTNSVVGSVYTGHQPHGVAVDDDKQLVIVAHRNMSPGGPAPHHASVCGSRNGYVSFINMNSHMLLAGRNIELSADPYACLMRP